MTQVLDIISTDDPKKAQGALNDGYMMTIQPFVLSEADFNPCCFPTGVIIYILHKMAYVPKEVLKFPLLRAIFHY